MDIRVKWVILILITLINIIIIIIIIISILAETPSSEMLPKPAAVSAMLIGFILVSKSGYAKTYITITVIYLGLNCK